LKNFDSFINQLNLNKGNNYRTYIQNDDILTIIKSPYSNSSVYRIKELVSISFLADEYKYSCILLDNGDIQIKREEN